MSGQAVVNRIAVVCWTMFLVLGIHIDPARAQEPPDAFGSLGSRVKVGDRVYVKDVSSREVRGRIVELSPAQLGLAVDDDGRADFLAADVDIISRRDSRWNGTLIGLAIAGALGIWFEGGLADEYGRGDVSRGSMAVPFALMGAGIGFAVDWAIPGRRVIYSRQRASGRPTSLAGQWSDRRKSVMLSIRF